MSSILPTRPPRSIFLEALDLAPAERSAFLDSECGDDAALREQVAKLLAAHGRLGQFMARPAAVPVTRDMNAAGDAEEDSADMIGVTIGRYRLLEQIGEGGMGIVYVAEQTEPVRRQVALKIIKPGMDSRQVIARFEAERQALALMDHPHIARILDGGMVGPAGPAGLEPANYDVGRNHTHPISDLRSPTSGSGRPYFVMELVRGRPITDYCDQARLTPNQRLELFVTVCQAVQHAHQKGIIHRDLKPSNVLVTVTDGQPVVKVIDFGVAKALSPLPLGEGQGEGVIRLTEKTLHTGIAQVIGTPLYMSPEQAELGALDIDTRSDVYSLGVLLYELLTGHTPFDRETLKNAGFDEMRRIIREDEPPRPSARISTIDAPHISTVAEHRGLDQRRLVRHLRGELDWIVMKCLEKDRDRRYESAGALAEDVQRYVDHLPIQARPTSLVTRALKWRKRNPVAFLAGLAAILLLAASVSAGVWHNQRLARELAVSNDLRKQAIERERRLNEEMYTNDIRLAWQAAVSGARPEARRYLERHIPRTGENDYVGFEWHYLNWLTQPPIRTISGAAQPILCMDISPPVDGHKQLAASGGEKGEIRISELSTGRLVHSFRHSDREVHAIKFSPRGDLLATGGQGSMVRIWDVHSWDEVGSLTRHDGTVCSISWSPDGTLIASSGRDRAVFIFDVATGEVLQSLRRHDDVVREVAWSPDGRWFATLDGTQGIRVWDAISWQERGLLAGYNAKDDSLLSLTFSPDSSTIACCGYSGPLQLFEVETMLPIVQAPAGTARALAFNGNSQIIAGLGSEGLQIWSFNRARSNLTLLQNRTAGRSAVRSVAPTHQGSILVTAQEQDATITVLDAASQVGAIVLSASKPVGVISTPMTVLSADSNNSLTLRPVDPGCKTVRIEPCYAPAGFAISTDDKWLAVADSAQSASIRRIDTGEIDRKLSAPPTSRLRQLRFSSDGQWLGAGCEPATVGAWDLKTGEWRMGPSPKVVQPAVVAMSPTENLFAFSTVRGVELWNLDQDKEKGFHVANDVVSLQFSRDGNLLFVGEGAVISVWDPRAASRLDALEAHSQPVHCLAVSPDNRTLASASQDGTVKLWSIPMRRELFTLCENIHANWLSFLPDGSFVVASSSVPGLLIYPGASLSGSLLPKQEFGRD